MDTTSFNFEQSLSQLEAIVSRLEKGELTLEDSLAQFETGMLLARQCQDVLNQAEQKIETFIKDNPIADE